MANTLAYSDTATITAVKSFIVQAPGEFSLLFISKTFAIISTTVFSSLCYKSFLGLEPGNIKWGSITVLLTSCLTGLESAV